MRRRILTSKAVIMKDGKIIESVIIKSKARPWESADEVMKVALDGAGLTMKDIKYCVGTGYGRDKMILHQRGDHGDRLPRQGRPLARPLGAGPSSTSAARTARPCGWMRKGNMVKFMTNDKCASGTGRFLEVMARVLGIGLDDLGEMSAASKAPITMASACTVWAQADVIQHLNNRVPVEDIAAGVNNAMASRMAVLANSVGVERDVCMTGGVAKNDGVVTALEKLLGVRIKRIRRSDPQIAGRHRRRALRARKSEWRFPMIVAGCDIGSLTAKAVIMKDGKIARLGGDPGEDESPEESAREVMDLRARRRPGIDMEDIAYCVGTGYGRKHIPFVNDVESEIACHGRGAVWQVPSARTVVDIGGQDAKAIKVDENGNVMRYVYNDKCASGTGTLPGDNRRCARYQTG